MNGILVLDYYPLLNNKEYKRKIIDFMTIKKLTGVVWSQTIPTPSQTREAFDNSVFKVELVGLHDAQKSVQVLKYETRDKGLNFNLPIILLDMNQAAVSRGGFDCAIDLSEFRNMRMRGDGPFELERVFERIEKCLADWKLGRKRPSLKAFGKSTAATTNKQPEPKKRKWYNH